MNSIKKISLILLLLVCVFGLLYGWVVMLPPLLTSGIWGLLQAITLMALSVVVPGVLLWDFFKRRKSKGTTQ